MSLPLILEALHTHGVWEHTHTLKRGDFLCQAGDRNRHLWNVMAGTLRLYIDIEGTERCIRFGYPGDLVAALDSYISGEPTQFYVQALRKCEVRQISRSAFRSFIDADPKRGRWWQAVMSGMIYSQLEREIDLLLPSPEARYQRVLARSPRLFQEIPAKYIANYLRMTPETLSRLKRAAP